MTDTFSPYMPLASPLLLKNKIHVSRIYPMSFLSDKRTSDIEEFISYTIR